MIDLSCIPIGHRNAVKRSELGLLTRMDDRTLRREIEALRESGVVICNFQDGKGYFLPENDEEANVQFKINQSRIDKIQIQQDIIKQKIEGDGLC